MISASFDDISISSKSIMHFDDILTSDEQFDDTIYNFEDTPIQKQKKKPVFKQRKKWTKQEDNKLCQMVLTFGVNNWRILAKGMEGRNPRQCRERWNYYLNPNLSHADWTKDEDKMIMNLREQYGPKWMLIANYFPNRTDAMIKNRYNVISRAGYNKNKHDSYTLENDISKNNESAMDLVIQNQNIQEETIQNKFRTDLNNQEDTVQNFDFQKTNYFDITEIPENYINFDENLMFNDDIY